MLSCSSQTGGTDSIWVQPITSNPIPFTDPDLVNPQRGQYINLELPLRSETTTAGDKPWPGSLDEGNRFLWSEIQPRQSDAFDFSPIDKALAAAHSRGARFHFRIMSFASLGYYGDTISGVPGWLRSTPGATREFSHEATTYVVPNWNAEEYLGPLMRLITALGERYDRDERLEWFEFSGYGDWSENHIGFIATQLDAPGPDPGASEAQLGYYSQYGIQSITSQTITRLVRATLAAFPSTRIVTTANNPEIVRQLLAAKPAKPVGLRADCLGVYPPTEYWGSDSQSRYVITKDPVIAELLNRWRTAPVVTEWCNFQPNGPGSYFETALEDTVNYHVTLVASNAMAPPENYAAMWARTNKYAGYRYGVALAPNRRFATSDAGLHLSLRWTNFGTAPVYDSWQITYEITDGSGRIVEIIHSPFYLGSIAAEQNYDDIARDPAQAFADDELLVPVSGLAAGRYKVAAKVVWRDHKPGASHVVEYPPMRLAQSGRAENGGYPVAEFELG